jgi:hypothetical protein
MPRLEATPDEIAEHLALLDSTASRLRAYTKGLNNSQLAVQSDNKSWSVVQILAHLRGCADLWTYSIYAMLAEKEPTLALLDERRWAKAARYDWLPFDKSFKAFTLQRGELLIVLQALQTNAWMRLADIGGRKHSVFSQVRRMAKHENEHCDQIKALLKKAG